MYLILSLPLLYVFCVDLILKQVLALSWQHTGHLDPATPEGCITLRFAPGQNMLVQDSKVFFATLHISFLCFPAWPQISIPAVLASAHMVQ